MPTYVNLDTIQRPSNGLTLNPQWGDQVNDNFAAQQAQLTTMNSQLSTNTSNITTAQNNITTLQNGLASTNGQVSTNTNNIASVQNQVNNMLNNGFTSAGQINSSSTSVSFNGTGAIIGGDLRSNNGNIIALQTTGYLDTLVNGNITTAINYQADGGNGQTNLRIPNGIPQLAGGLEMVIVPASQQVGVPASTAALKENIVTLSEKNLSGETNPLWNMQPRHFRYKGAVVSNADHDPTDESSKAEGMAEQGPEEVGFIAEELEQVAPDVVVRDADGKPIQYAVRPMLAYAIDAIHHLRAEIDTLKGSSAAAA
jgi:hypothetical protein